MRSFGLAGLCLLIGCNPSAELSGPVGTQTRAPTTTSTDASAEKQQTLPEARAGFTTEIVSTGSDAEPADLPPDDSGFELIEYESPVGPLAAYLTTDAGDGKQHPAIVWITGGDNNTIGDVWSDRSRSNDQSASAFRRAGLVMMFPSQRGGNDNPGQREGFFGEVNDILAATDYLAALPYVDPDQIYLGGHSTGGTMVLVVAACTDRYRAIFSLGPVAAAMQYGGNFVYCDPDDKKEMMLRSPLFWLHSVNNPTYVFEGESGNWDGAISVMAEQNTNPNIQFFKVPEHDHFTVIAPLCELLADQIMSGQLDIQQQSVEDLQ